jgi:hypothetical protein
VLLFALLTMETQASFAQLARAAREEGRIDAAQAAPRMAGLALSVLWTLFATGLLAAGLGDLRVVDGSGMDVADLIERAGAAAPVPAIRGRAAPGGRPEPRAGGAPPAHRRPVLARTVGDPAAWAATALPARLGPPLARPAPAPSLPWTERHPALLWAGLVAVVAGLGALTWRMSKSDGATRASPGPPGGRA